MLKDVMFESEMEEYLGKEGYSIFDDEGCIDSVQVFDIAIDELDYTPYRLEGEGYLNDTYLFVKNK